MWNWIITQAAWLAGGLKTLVVGFVVGLVNLATSKTAKRMARRAGGSVASAGSATVYGSLSKASKWFPRARKVVVVGAIGGFRQLKTHYNKNSAKSVQSIRNSLSLVGKLSAATSVVVTFFVPVAGVALLIGTYVVFYKDPESLPLTVFSTDTAIESSLGIGTALVVSLFQLAGATRAAWRWIVSQFK